MMAKKGEAEVVEPSADDIPGNDETTAVVNWEEKLAAFAEEAADQEQLAGQWVSVRAGRLAIDKAPVADNKLDAIIVASAYENALYTGKFDPNNPKSPDCYAIGDNEDDLQPHEKAAEPQSEYCSSCQHNQWGSGEGGKGKACKNIRRLALLPADAIKTPDKIIGMEALYLKLPVMSVRNWIKYIKGLKAEVRRPAWSVVSQISTEPDAKAQFKVTFMHTLKISDPATLGALEARHQEEAATIRFPYPTNETAAAPEEEGSKKY